MALWNNSGLGTLSGYVRGYSGNGLGFANPSSFVGPLQENQVLGSIGSKKAIGALGADSNSGGLGLSDYISAGTGLLQGLGGLANAYLGFQNLKESKRQFGIMRALANRNLANQAKQINNAYDVAANVHTAMQGGTDAYGNQIAVDPSFGARARAYAQSQHLDGTPV